MEGNNELVEVFFFPPFFFKKMQDTGNFQKSAVKSVVIRAAEEGREGGRQTRNKMDTGDNSRMNVGRRYRTERGR